jgi:hypothetical protein
VSRQKRAAAAFSSWNWDLPDAGVQREQRLGGSATHSLAAHGVEDEELDAESARAPAARHYPPLTAYVSRKVISCAPCQRNIFPSGRRLPLPSTIVAKWFPASWPAFEAKLT